MAVRGGDGEGAPVGEGAQELMALQELMAQWVVSAPGRKACSGCSSVAQCEGRGVKQGSPVTARTVALRAESLGVSRVLSRRGRSVGGGRGGGLERFPFGEFQTAWVQSLAPLLTDLGQAISWPQASVSPCVKWR